MKDPDGGIATYTWDNANRMTALLNRYNENTIKGYNAVNLENDGNFGNGMRWRRTFNPDYTVQYRTLQHSSAQSSTQILRYSATYDAAGRRTTQVDPAGTATYTYDAANQLIREQHGGSPVYDIQYSYDGMGNRTTMTFNGAVTTYAHDVWNRLLSRQNPDGTITSYAYDGAGNRITETTGSDVTTYTWDYENRLSGVQHPLTGGIETFTYLLGGERTVESGLGKGLRHSVENSTGKRFMVWDGQNLLQERDASGSLIAHYTGRPDDYWSLISQRRGSTTLYAIGDIEGNVRQWFASDETSPGSFDFSAFGESLHTTGSVVTPFGFEGEYGYYSDVDGRLYVRARELDAENGIWCSVDPIGFAGRDFNLYRNVKNNPANAVDPRGTHVVLIRGGSGHSGNDPTHSVGMQELGQFIKAVYKESVFQPEFFWNPGERNTPWMLPHLTPPGVREVIGVLHQIYDYLADYTKNPAKYSPGSSDPHGIWLYGTSYGGHIAGQIASAKPGSQIAGLKNKIERDFCVTFRRTVVSVVDAKDYPAQFTRIDANLYTVAGDIDLGRKYPGWSEGIGREAAPGWFDPEHYNSRGLTRAGTWIGYKDALRFIPSTSHQAYWYSGGTDIVVQLPTAVLAPQKPSSAPGVYIPNLSPQVFYHESFDASQGLSQNPSYTVPRGASRSNLLGSKGVKPVGVRNPFQDYLISQIVSQLMKGHP